MGTMVIEVPAELKCLGEAMADSLAAVRSAMARAVALSDRWDSAIALTLLPLRQSVKAAA